MSTGTASTASGRSSSNSKVPTLEHTLDIKAIVQTQTENAASLSKFKEDWNAWTTSIKETRGMYIGVKLQPATDMTWLGSGENHQSMSAAYTNIPIPATVKNNASIFPSFQNLEFRYKMPRHNPGFKRFGTVNVSIIRILARMVHLSCSLSLQQTM
jgi:hypothetical protein